MKRKQIEDTLWRFCNRLSNRFENEAVEKWYDQVEQLGEDTFHGDELDIAGERLRDNLAHYIGNKDRTKRKRAHYLISSVATLAASLLIFMWFNSTKTSVVHAGSDKATLIIGSDAPIDLNELKVGQVLEQENVRIFKSNEGEIVYEVLPIQGSYENDINTLRVPQGGKFSVNLPDGSHVWLNSNSELRYPTSFAGSIRQIELKGEAFFDVKHDDSKPFVVKTNRADIRVLGTKFNIQAYENEPNWKTTVAEGKVSVSNTQHKIILHKNEQAIVDHRGMITYAIVEDNEAFAWKDGSFHFQGTNIEDIARQVERWYNVEVEVDPRVKGQEFFGIIPRQENANQLFEVLEATNTIRVVVTKEKIKIYPRTN